MTNNIDCNKESIELERLHLADDVCRMYDGTSVFKSFEVKRGVSRMSEKQQLTAWTESFSSCQRQARHLHLLHKLPDFN